MIHQHGFSTLATTARASSRKRSSCVLLTTTSLFGRHRPIDAVETRHSLEGLLHEFIRIIKVFKLPGRILFPRHHIKVTGSNPIVPKKIMLVMSSLKSLTKPELTTYPCPHILKRIVLASPLAAAFKASDMAPSMAWVASGAGRMPSDWKKDWPALKASR